MPVVVFGSGKGGVGKTMVSLNVAGELQRRGRSVLLIDLDPQATLSYTFGVDYSNTVPGSADVLDPEMPRPLHEVIIAGVRPRMDLVPAAEVPLQAMKARLQSAQLADLNLRDAIAGARTVYDWIIMDVPPDKEVLVRNAVTAADGIVSVSDPDSSALRGAIQLEAVAKRARTGYQGVNPQFLGVLWNQCRAQERNVDEDVFGVADSIEWLPQFRTRILEREVFRQAKESRMPVWEESPRSDAAHMISDLVDEIVARCAALDIELPGADRPQIVTDAGEGTMMVDLREQETSDGTSVAVATEAGQS